MASTCAIPKCLSFVNKLPYWLNEYIFSLAKECRLREVPISKRSRSRRFECIFKSPRVPAMKQIEISLRINIPKITGYYLGGQQRQDTKICITVYGRGYTECYWGYTSEKRIRNNCTQVSNRCCLTESG